MNTLMLKGLVAVAVIAAIVFGGAALVRGESTRTATALFANSTGVYPGDEVRVLGVPVGTIDKIEPTSRGARITFSYEGDLKVPADAQALIVAPSLVSSRYVQLTPQYAGGPVLADAATIPRERTGVPVEFDQIKGQLDTLATAFGPSGVNQDGSLSSFITTTQQALQGQGPSLNATIAQLSQAAQTLDTGRGDIFGTVQNLQVFVSALATSDQQIREFDQRLDTVSGILDDNKDSLTSAIRALEKSLREVGAFAKENRAGLASSVKGLADVLAIVSSQQAAVEEVLHVGPNALRNLLGAYDPKTNSLSVGLQAAATQNLQQLICGAVGSVGTLGQSLAASCATFLGPLLTALSTDLPINTAILTQVQGLLGIAKGNG